MLTELGLIYGAGVLLKYNSDSIGIFPHRKTIFQNNKDLREFQPSEKTRYFLVNQWGLYDFELRVISKKEEFIESKFGQNIYNVPIKRKVGSSDKRGLESLFKEIGSEISSEDVFYFATSRHSSSTGNWFERKFDTGEKALSYFWEEKKKVKIKLSELQEMLYPITNSGSINILYFDTCFAGDFAKVLGKENNIAIATTKPGKILLIRPKMDLWAALNHRKQKFMGTITKTRYSFEESFFSGKSVSTSFNKVKHERIFQFGLTLVKPHINHPHMYVGNIDPETVYII